jgi:hypothetical protein
MVLDEFDEVVAIAQSEPAARDTVMIWCSLEAVDKRSRYNTLIRHHCRSKTATHESPV